MYVKFCLKKESWKNSQDNREENKTKNKITKNKKLKLQYILAILKYSERTTDK
jgi:hypothetical protein